MSSHCVIPFISALKQTNIQSKILQERPSTDKENATQRTVFYPMQKLKAARQLPSTAAFGNAFVQFTFVQ